MSTTAVEPSNVEAEEAVLGAMLLSEVAVDRAAEMLEPGSFYRDAHASIFAAVCKLRGRGEPVEPLVVAAELERLGVLASIGGRARLAELQSNVSAAGNVGHYAALVLDAARSRSVFRAALALQKSAQNGGLALHPELLDELQAVVAAARSLPGEPAMPEAPLFVDAYDFVASQSETPAPLWGSRDMPLIAEGGLVILAGRPGTGKTTFILDLSCALAAGIPFPSVDEDNSRAPSPWPTSRPLRIAVIENEGPQEMFRGKLRDKLACFPHPIREVGGLIVIQTWAWGSFSFRDGSVQARVRRELDELEIDLVLGDPLKSLGVEGVGSPAETDAFVQTLKPLGLGTVRAFLFLHHFRERVERDEDELRALSGAWGPHLDTLLTLQSTHSQNEVRLNYPKVRWARGPTPKAIILGRVWKTASFEGLADEGDATHLEPQIASFLAAAREAGRGLDGWHKLSDVSRGVQQRQADTRLALTGAPHLFCSATGDAAIAHGAKNRATILWGLAEWVGERDDEPGQGSLDELAEDAIASSGEPEPLHDDIPF